MTHGFSPWGIGLAIPPLTLGNHALFNMVAVNIVGWVHLIKMHIYMMPQFNTCCMSRYTIGDNSNSKHNITKPMVGPWPLAPHHDYLQCIYIYIYIYHVYLMHRGQNRGVTFPSPLNSTVLSALQNLNKMLH